MARPLSHNGLIILKIRNSNPRETYAGLLWICQNRGRKPGWVFHQFLKIYGKKPRPLTEVQPQVPTTELVEYLGIMQNRWRQKRKREEAKIGAAILGAVANHEPFKFSGEGLDPV